MKKYKVVKPEGLERNESALNLQNIDDPTDIVMCAEDEFVEGEIIEEEDIFYQDASYVYDDGVATGIFAFMHYDINRINDGNKLIAKYLNINYVLNDNKTGKPYYANFSYYRSWNTLIPLYSKIMESENDDRFSDNLFDHDPPEDEYDSYALQKDFEEAVYNNKPVWGFHAVVKRLEKMKQETLKEKV